MTDSASPPEAGGTCSACHCEPPRRSFMTNFLAAATGALAGLIPTGIGGLFFLDPLLRKKHVDAGSSAAGGVQKDDKGFIRMAITVDALPNDGAPQKFTVLDDIINAWNKSPNQPIGSVWLRKINNQVIAFNALCPHLGCAVEHRAAQSDFYCPCHTSAFDLDGKKLNAIPPRDMDSLDLDVRGNEIWIKFQNFRGATNEKVPV